MSRRENAAFRCKRCRMHETLCVCSLLPSPRLETKTRVLLVIHRREDKKPTNTGRLATECLANSAVVVRGRRAEPTAPLAFDPSTTPVLLFPHEGATSLAELAARTEKPLTLVVPDGNWRQASKVRARVPGISALPCVSLPAAEPTMYRLRSESHDAGLATIEAIARAMGMLEGREGPHVQEVLERIFRAMVERTLWSRGALATEDVSAGIPMDTAHRARRP